MQVTRHINLYPKERHPMSSDDFDWQRQARCRNMDPSVFFPDDGERMSDEDIAYAKGVCADCPVREFCLEYAVTTMQQWGVWGGTTDRERRAIRRKRRQAGTTSASRHDAIERATEARKLAEMGCTPDQIAGQLGVHVRTAQRLTAASRVPVAS